MVIAGRVRPLLVGPRRRVVIALIVEIVVVVFLRLVWIILVITREIWIGALRELFPVLIKESKTKTTYLKEIIPQKLVGIHIGSEHTGLLRQNNRRIRRVLVPELLTELPCIIIGPERIGHAPGPNLVRNLLVHVRKNLQKLFAAALGKPQLHVAAARQQIVQRQAVELQIIGTENGLLEVLFAEVGQRHVDRLELVAFEFGGDEDHAGAGEVDHSLRGDLAL